MKISLYFFLLCSYFTTYAQQSFDDELEIEITKDIEELNALIIKEPKNVENYYFRGYRYYESKQYLDAISNYDTAISLNPKDAKIYFSRGISNMKLKRFKNAIEDFYKKYFFEWKFKKILF